MSPNPPRETSVIINDVSVGRVQQPHLRASAADERDVISSQEFRGPAEPFLASIAKRYGDDMRLVMAE